MKFHGGARVLLAVATPMHSSPANGNVLVRFQHGFEHYFERLRNSSRGLLSLARTHPVRVVAGFLGVAALSLCVAPL
ncbi:MAG: hypothetical protein WA231_02090 [Methylocella sp.]